MSLIGIVGTVILLVDGLVADGSDLVIVLTGGFADDSILIKGIDHIDQAALGHAGFLTEAGYHVFQSLAGLDHGHIVLFLSDETFGLRNSVLNAFPGA